jgi:ABC-type multidrug transport system fused ATPase/permease subunit
VSSGAGRELLAHLRAHPRETSVAVVSLVASTAALYLVARWSGSFIPQLMRAAAPAELWREALTGLVLLAVATGGAAARDVALVSLSASFSSALRLRVLGALLREPAALGRVRSAGRTLMGVTSDISLLHQALVRTLAIWAPSVVTSVVLLAAVVATSAPLALATALLIAPMLFVIGRVSGRLQGSLRLAQDHLADLGAAVGDALSGVREAKVFRREDVLERQFAALSERSVRQIVHEERVAVTHPALVTFFAFVGLSLLVLLAAAWARRGAIDGASLTRFLVLLGLLVAPLQESIRSFSAVTRLRTLLDRCRAVADGPVERETPGARELIAPAGALAFVGARVHYPQTGFTLGPVDLEVRPGETVVFVGPSGSGKSTLIELVPRLVDPTDGVVQVDGTDVRALTLASLRRACAFVPQEPYFFAGTIAENLRFAGSAIPDDALVAACRAAHADEFVRRLPQGYEARLERGGVNLSVGQRRRLAIARAMLVDPQILLLDEPTAALDEESERLLVEALRRFSVGRTTLIVSHSAPLLALAHRVVRIEGGRVVSVERGPRADAPAPRRGDALSGAR